MNQPIKNYLGIAIIAALAATSVASVWYVSVYSASTPSARSFTVSGEGKVIAVPDIAELSMSVLIEGGKNLSDLQKQNAEKTNRIIAFAKDRGVSEKDIQTRSYNISPRYQYFSCSPIRSGGETKPCPPAEIVGYSINQTISVKIRNLNSVGDILAGAVDAGANTVSGPVFTIDDPNTLQNQAREEAVSRAKEKARVIAKAGGFRLGKILSVNEGAYLPQPMLFAGRSAAFDVSGGGAAPVIEPGSQEIQVSVTVTYAMR